MYEFGVEPSLQVDISSSDNPEALFLLAIGTLGDVAAAINSADFESLEEWRADLDFAASFFDAFIAARFREDLDPEVLLLASAAYFVARRPGSSLVLARSIRHESDYPCEIFLAWLLRASWGERPTIASSKIGDYLTDLGQLVSGHFIEGTSPQRITDLVTTLREHAYDTSEAYELLLIDLICAVVRLRIASSAWTVLPNFSGVAPMTWRPFIASSQFPKELWPSQIRLGQHGLFSGASGIVQMPTSAGKTRSLEIVIRSAFLAGRANLAVIVAPFRALCHEIAMAMKASFSEADVGVNELSDVLQRDYGSAFEIGAQIGQSKGILILTPEKLLFVLRQTPSLIEQIGIVIYDEGHQFDSGSRGITYELLLTEIKELLPSSAQTLLVSAVINNARAIGAWLIGSGAEVVDGTGLLPTSRSVAFASWLEQLGQLVFFESQDYSKVDYAVPQVIQERELDGKERERKKLFFPDKKRPADVALFLGLKLASRGAVAVFCGRKDSAASLAARAVEIYSRGYDQPPPLIASSEEEVFAIQTLTSAHFGEDSDESKAASLGVFVHHGNTPEGIRLAVEYAMQRGRIKFVACTSTLAQGVNLPIRYLIVSTVYQAGEKIKVRDFQNLMGRAGMHTEGLIIFADPDTYDRRRSAAWKFDSSVALLNSANSEDIASSLLSLIDPIDGKFASVRVPSGDLIDLLFGDIDANEWVRGFLRENRRAGLKKEKILSDIARRQSLLSSLESYLMANRGDGPFGEFRQFVESLATRTLAYSLSSTEEREALLYLFRATADYVEEVAPESSKQKAYAKTLLGVVDAAKVDSWLAANIDGIRAAIAPDQILNLLWPLFRQISSSKFIADTRPEGLAKEIANAWLAGKNYRGLFDLASARGGTRSWGSSRRKLTSDAIVSFLEGGLAFDCALISGAVLQFLENYQVDEAARAAVHLFQKQLKYGLPDSLSISIYEFGFADRVIAQKIRDELLAREYRMENFNLGIIHRSVIRDVLSTFPSYFKTVVATRDGST